jgi:hypothetical protein
MLSPIGLKILGSETDDANSTGSVSAATCASRRFPVMSNGDPVTVTERTTAAIVTGMIAAGHYPKMMMIIMTSSTMIRDTKIENLGDVEARITTAIASSRPFILPLDNLLLLRYDVSR